MLPPPGVAPEHPRKDSSQPNNIAQTKAEKSSTTTSLLTMQKSTHSTLPTAVRSQTPQPGLKYSTGTNGEVCGQRGPQVRPSGRSLDQQPQPSSSDISLVASWQSTGDTSWQHAWDRRIRWQHHPRLGWVKASSVQRGTVRASSEKRVW